MLYVSSHEAHVNVRVPDPKKLKKNKGNYLEEKVRNFLLGNIIARLDYYQEKHSEIIG